MQLAAIRAQRDQLLVNAGQLMRRTLFGTTGYGLDIYGTEESVSRLQLDDLRSLHRQLITPKNSVLAIFGDISPPQARQAVEHALGAWPAGQELALPDSPRLIQGTHRVTEIRDKTQAVLMIGFPGTTIHHPDRYPLELVQEACSDLGSRLFLRIRDQLGLAYYVGAQNFLGLVPGYFAFYAGTAPDSVALAEQEMTKESALLRASGLTALELQRAKAKLIGQKKIARQDLGAYAMTAALDELYGLGYANIDTEDAKYEAVTVAQTRAAAEKYLNPESCAIAVLLPEKAQ